MATVLTLTLHMIDTVIKGGKTVVEKSDKVFTIGAADCKDTYGSLVSIKVHKEVFTPGFIEAEVQYAFTTAESELRKLPGTTVDLADSNGTIAKDYVILKVVPVYTNNSKGTSLYVRFLIYSPDKLLAFRKYNKSYVAQRLGDDILKAVTKNGDDKATPLCAIDSTNLQHLMVAGGNGASKKGEFIQPYLVQYDESAHDFLSRVANRCGEFLFYEDGKWQLGVNTSAAKKTVSNYDSLVFNYSNEASDDFLWANDYTGREPNDPPKKPEKNAKQADQDKYTAELDAYNAKIKAGVADYKGPLDEYVSTYERKVTGSFSNYAKSLVQEDDEWFFKNPSWIIEHITSWLQGDNLATIVASEVTDLAKKAIVNGIILDDENKSWNSDNIDAFKGKVAQCDNDSAPTKVAPYTNYAAVGKYMHQFYASILAHGQEAERGACHIDLGTNYMSLSVGDIITVNNADYVVTHVEFSYSIKTGSQHDVRMTVDALPPVGGEWYPAPLKGGTMKTVEPQTAIVTATGDPLSLGRIQIRYPWQPASDKPSSPWIRIAAPFTSKDSAIRFVPQKGDEIMVGYEYGNIERPFMMGAMQSDSNNGADDEKYIIKSPNGHYIKFSNPKNAQGLLTSTFAPFWSAWSTYVPSLPKSTDAWFKGGAGGITMGDKYGFYKISMSTDKRSVSINSALGKVSISALTGITISAPNGNVKISGKNVEISAANNLKITSGGNIKKVNDLHKASYGTIIGAAAISSVTSELSSLLPAVDLTLLRTVAEAFLKPIGGNMLIKSNRFLRLEAGKGKTELPDDYLINTPKEIEEKNFSKTTDTLNGQKATDTVKQIQALMTTVSAAFNTLATDLRSRAAEYNNAIAALTAAGAANPAGVLFDSKVIAAVEITGKVEKAEEIIEAALKKEHDYGQLAQYRTKLGKVNLVNAINDAPLKRAYDAADSIVNAVAAFFSALDNKAPTDNMNFSLDKDLNDYPEKGKKYTQDDYKKEVEEYVKTAWESIKTVMQKDLQERVSGLVGGAQPLVFDKPEKRKILYDTLFSLHKAEVLTIANERSNAVDAANRIMKLKARPAIDVEKDRDAIVYDTKGAWTQFLKCVTVYDKEKAHPYKALAKDLLKSAVDMDNWPFPYFSDSWKENHSINPAMTGQIMLSSSENYTCSIAEKTLDNKENAKDDALLFDNLKTL